MKDSLHSGFYYSPKLSFPVSHLTTKAIDVFLLNFAQTKFVNWCIVTVHTWSVELEKDGGLFDFQ